MKYVSGNHRENDTLRRLIITLLTKEASSFIATLVKDFSLATGLYMRVLVQVIVTFIEMIK